MTASSTFTGAHRAYDVYINNRGPDVKNTFISHLYRRLLSQGLRVFSIEGENSPTQITEAIRTASVNLAIFSPRYADSSWCLDELQLMLECKAPIIPVYYHVNPTEVRCTKGKAGHYAEALQHHAEKLCDSATIEKWRNALSHVAGISGFELDAFNGDEGALLDSVVQHVLEIVKKQELLVAKYPIDLDGKLKQFEDTDQLQQYPVGLDEKLKQFEDTVLLQQQHSRKPQILGTDQLAMTASFTFTGAHRAYDVYINHRGPDVKKTFVSHLYRRLLSQGLRVFVDSEELRRGENIATQIAEAIRTASVNLAIFSPRYADSSWCLNELQLMLECKAPIIPVYYHVNPTEVRWTGGKAGHYAEALQHHEEKLRYDYATIEMWRNALSHVARISGFELDAFNGDEGALLDSVVQHVLEIVKKQDTDQLQQYPVGLDEKLKQFEDTVLLQQQHSRKPQILGIVGLGGIGKTTLAKEFFNRKKSDYHRSCFLSVGNNEAKGSLNLLQKKLIKSLTRLNRPVGSVDEGRRMLIKPLKSSKVLIVLDDVDHVDQVDALLPVTHDLRTGSLILITTTDIDLLRQFGVENPSIFTQTGLNEQHSLQLFCFHAFRQAYPIPEFEAFVPKFLKSCEGSPLCLKVFGALLYGEDTSYWEDKVDSLQKIFPTEIQQPLMISYDSLNEEEKQIFLDIACFFIGENSDMAIRIWDSFGWKGRGVFRNLQNKCLVEVDSRNVIHMHHFLRDLGREVAAHSSPRRLWCWTENVSDYLVQQSSNPQVITVHGIRTVLSEYNGDNVFSAIGMMSLQLPDAENSQLDPISTRVKFSNLVWLCWRECPYTSLPSWIPMVNLRVLQVSGSTLETLWQDGSQAPLLLEELWADGCMQLKSVRGLARCTELRKLVVSKCWELEELPSMETFVSLQELRVDECVTLKSIRGLEQCTKLRRLNVSGCSELEKLPRMDTLQSLEEFYASGCVKVKIIRGLEQCTELRHLNVSECRELEKLPSMKTLVSLEELRVDECVKLEDIGELDQFTKLRHLDVSGCFKLEALQSMDRLVSLEELWANRCVKLKSIRGLEHATNLRQLNFSQCSELKELPNMEMLKCLEELWADDCVNLKSIKGLEQASKLRLLNVSDCSQLEELPIMEKLVSLQILRATGCVKLNSIRGLEHCTELWMLSVSRCCELEELPCMETLVSLEEFYASECVKLKSIQGLKQLTKLRYFNVSNCPELKELPSMETLESLEMVGVTRCVNLTSIQGLAQCTKLRNLTISGCCELEKLPGIEMLTSLEVLRVDQCVKLRSITGLGQCTKLRHLDVSGCSEFEEFPGMDKLESLEEFYAAECKKLQIIWGLECCTKLRRLSVFGCSELKELPSMEMLVTLEVLLADNCVKLEKIEGLAKCADLRTLSIDGCPELEELPSMETLVSLEELRVNNCGKLKSIRGLAQCTMLRHLDVRQCSELIELEGVEHCTLLNKLDLSTCPKLLLDVGVLDQLRGRLHGRLKGGMQSRRGSFATSAAIKVAICMAVVFIATRYRRIR